MKSNEIMIVSQTENYDPIELNNIFKKYKNSIIQLEHNIYQIMALIDKNFLLYLKLKNNLTTLVLKEDDIKKTMNKMNLKDKDLSISTIHQMNNSIHIIDNNYIIITE